MPCARVLVLAASLLLAIPAHAQKPSPLLTAASQSQDLELPAKPSSFSSLGSPRMALYKPAQGLFPR